MLNEVLERCLREVQKPTPVAVAVAPRTPDPLYDPSPAQIQYYKVLVSDKQMTDLQRADLTAGMGNLTKQQMSQAISTLVALPWIIRAVPQVSVKAPQKTWDTIGQGYYAVVDPKDQILKFYKVQRPKKGNWTGFVFIKRVSGENLEPVGSAQEREVIFKEIEKDVMGALKRYGQEIGQCGHCKKQLTDAESRAFGIGPVCRKALGV